MAKCLVNPNFNMSKLIMKMQSTSLTWHTEDINCTKYCTCTETTINKQDNHMAILLNDFLNEVYIILEPLANPMCLINTHLLCGLETFTTASLGWQVSTDWPALAAAAEAVAHPSVSPPPKTNAPAPSPTSAAPGGAAPSPRPSVVAPGPGRPSSADTWHLPLTLRRFKH